MKCSNGNVGIMDGTSILCTKNYSIARNDTLEPLQICTNSTLTDHDYGDLPIYNSLSIYKSDIVKYKAGFITRSIRIKINCDQCSDALVSHTITSQLSNRKNGGGLINPSEDVVNICLYVERLLTPQIVYGVLSNTKIHRLKVASLRSVSDNTLFTKLLQHSYVAGDLGVDHRIIIITNIIAKYINIRLFQISKLINQKNCIKRIRKKFTKLILFNNE